MIGAGHKGQPLSEFETDQAQTASAAALGGVFGRGITTAGQGGGSSSSSRRPGRTYQRRFEIRLGRRRAGPCSWGQSPRNAAPPSTRIILPEVAGQGTKRGDTLVVPEAGEGVCSAAGWVWVRAASGSLSL